MTLTTGVPAPRARRVDATWPEHALVVLIGAAGAGKSALAAREWAPSQVLSLDALRGWVSDDVSDQDATQDAVGVLHALVSARLRRRLTTVVDATNVEAHARLPLLDLARAHQMPAVAVVVATPLPICHARNATRPGPQGTARWGRRVPVEALDTQHQRMRASLLQLKAEGFAQVRVTRA
jgi:predicted kinase